MTFKNALSSDLIATVHRARGEKADWKQSDHKSVFLFVFQSDGCWGFHSGLVQWGYLSADGGNNRRPDKGEGVPLRGKSVLAFLRGQRPLNLQIRRVQVVTFDTG